jgi:hypothetical protein
VRPPKRQPWAPPVVGGAHVEICKTIKSSIADAIICRLHRPLVRPPKRQPWAPPVVGGAHVEICKTIQSSTFLTIWRNQPPLPLAGEGRVRVVSIVTVINNIILEGALSRGRQ